ncbi:hypothetical protein G9A89_005004 [Geosiphon pyriformis]|nr:hypothetical protein G9A89_005004 [Geosiphon pyriformis]
MAYYAHQTYCLLDESGFVEKDIYGIWVAPAYRKILRNKSFIPTIVIQVRGRELTFDRMVELDRSMASKTLKLGLFANSKVPLEFYQRFKRKLKDKILKSLEKYVSYKNYRDYADYNFIFTGHGEGGALATYAAVEFWRKNRDVVTPDQIAIITYGAPRIGDENFIRYISQRFFVNRVTYINDYVPLFLSRTFKHPNTEYWILRDICNCGDDKPIIFNCHQIFGTENPDCNLQFQELLLKGELDNTSKTHGSFIDAHNGPYFGYRMKQLILPPQICHAAPQAEVSKLAPVKDRQSKEHLFNNFRRAAKFTMQIKL